MSALELEGLRARYGLARVLDGVSLSVAPGEVLAVLGRNGSGKTTTLLSLFGVPTVDGGTMVAGGRLITGKLAHLAARHGLAISPQGRRIIGGLTVRENLLVGAAVRRPGPWSLDSVYQLFPALREKSDVPGVALSGGQQQMLAIGRALMANPSVLLLDEPSEGLSPVLVDEVATAIREIRHSGTAVVLVEHHLSLVRAVSQSYAVLEKGTTRAHGAMADLHVDELREHMGLSGPPA